MLTPRTPPYEARCYAAVFNRRGDFLPNVVGERSESDPKHPRPLAEELQQL